MFNQFHARNVRHDAGGGDHGTGRNTGSKSYMRLRRVHVQVCRNLIGDRAYDSDPLDEELRNDGIEMIAPHRSNRSKSPTQDRRRLSRYTRRWLVERFFAWIQNAQNFLGFVQLACLVILDHRQNDAPHQGTHDARRPRA
jgi:transposase